MLVNMKNKNSQIMKEILIFILIFATTFSFYKIPLKDELFNNDLVPKTSQFVSRNIRIAIYNEPNVTLPSYVSVATLTNNYTDIKANLINSGYQVSELTCDDIYNHKLKTVNFDILILADNVPRENITNYVKEFWLGGGAILSFDSALAYLCYFGILIPESAGDDGRLTYWTYLSSPINNISMRHPSSKSYNIDDTFTISPLNWAVLDWVALQGSVVSNDFYKIAFRQGDTDDVSVVAYDPAILSGGKVIHILSNFMLNADDLIIDAIEWLCPRPKGRILFDLSHFPYYGIDPWDSLATAPGNYEILRDNLVNRSYTIDKLYPSATGNLTTNNLAPYDALIICLPDLNFTASEVSAVTNWVNNGGGIITIGENPGSVTEDTNINYLYSNFGLSMNLTDGGSNTVTYTVEHPTLEGCSQITALAPGLIVYSGSAYPIWGNNADEIIVGGQEFGKGRVILMADFATLRDSSMPSYDNLQYGINLINWLTASQAEVLLYLDQIGGPDPNDNYYRAPVTNALNDLGVSFYLTHNIYYFNLSMSFDEYPLAIIDNPAAYIGSYFGDVLNYVKSGGHLIISSYVYGVSSGNTLWDYLGFEPTGDTFSAPQTIYIWDNPHPIFNTPAEFGATSINSTYDYVATDVCNLTLYSNATAIAGLTSSFQTEGAAIILGAGGRSIANAMLITTYMDDTDDSTYSDAQELWENEIAYMMSIIHYTPPITPGGINWFLIIIIGAIALVVIAVVIIIFKKRKK